MAGRRGRVAAVPKALLKGLNAQSQASLTAALQAPGAPSKDDPRYNSFVESLRGSLLTKQGLRRRGSSAGTGERDDASESEDEEEENGSEDDAKAKDEEDEPQGQRGKRLSRSSSAAVLVEPVAIPLSEQPLLSKETLRQSLANTSAKGKEKLDVDVEDLFQDIVSAFVRESLVGACRLSRHRRSTMLEMRDLQLHLGMCFA